ncbi:MAG TPA: hypothetical protein VFK59_10115 [Actinomycetota bacterium]|jgi:hypothetical protein|nr:hypothetical protein [Actinomycetota bacterium]
MRRFLCLLVGVLLALPACTGSGDADDGPSPSVVPTATTPPDTPSPEPTSSPTPEPSPRPIPPAWARPIEEDLDPEALADDALIPPGATLTGRVELPAAGSTPDQVAVAYALGEDPFAAEHGVAVWERFADLPAWSVVYAFVDPPEEGVLGIRLEAGDLTGDGHADVLTLEDRGGSGACGTWTVVSGTAEDTARIFRRQTCDAEIVIDDGGLRLREAVFEPDDPHCCPSAFRTSRLEWDGERFVVVSSDETPAGS